MTESLDDLYLGWLYAQVADVNSPRRQQKHWFLIAQMHSKPFEWFIPNDDARASDGMDLRTEFLLSHGVNPDPNWMGPCTMLELFVGLARRLYFEGDGEPAVWFWHLIEMLGLEQYNDANYGDQAQAIVDEALTRVIQRTYQPNGVGGLFPLRNPTCDQREVELWYQLNAYLNEL